MTNFVQFKLWYECNNGCAFCSEINKWGIDKHKKERLESAWKKINELDLKGQRLGFIGGEFFQGQIGENWPDWVDFIEKIDNFGVGRIFFTATLTDEKCEDLYKTLELIKKTDVTICTSWDAVGRFHGEGEGYWESNCDRLHEMGYDVCCTVIPTQDFFESGKEFPEWMYVNLCEPHAGCDWYINVDKKNYHERLLEDIKEINLPKRESALRWMMNHKEITRHVCDYLNNHSNDIYEWIDGEYIATWGDRLVNNKNFVNKCGHPYFSMCYIDSDECIQCDARRILDI